MRWTGLRVGSSSGQVSMLCSWAQQLTLIKVLSTKVYKLVSENFQGIMMKYWPGEGVLALEKDWHPIVGEGEVIFLVASCERNWDMLRLHGTLSASTHFTFSNQTPDSLSGAHTINVLSIEADSNDMGWVNDPSPVKLKMKDKDKDEGWSIFRSILSYVLLLFLQVTQLEEN